MAAIYSNGRVTAGIFLASILLKEIRYLVSSVYKISMTAIRFIFARQN